MPQAQGLRGALLRAASPFGYRYPNLGGDLEALLVSAVSALLLIRFYLQLTGFPQIGGGGLHIAHLLWGGLLLLAAVIMLTTYVGRWARRWAAIIGGIGFGTFIDELGKFVTSSNDYFFQPAIASIYVIFVVLFLLIRVLEQEQRASEPDAWVGAAVTATDVLLGQAKPADVERALARLRRWRGQGPVPDALETLLLHSVPVVDQPTWFGRVVTTAHDLFERFIDWRWLQRALIGYFVFDAILSLLFAVAFVGDGGDSLREALANLSSPDLAYPFSVLLSTVLMVVGLVLLGLHARPAALRWLRASVLVSILLTQVFLFFESQLAALGGLTVDLVALSTLNALLAREPAKLDPGIPSEKTG
jgi:hypothetical protein